MHTLYLSLLLKLQPGGAATRRSIAEPSYG
jgi:hypothetical protein